ncbi:MAG TPA: hypothetical protein VLI54_00830 [Bacillota bacterium]|nr:hypothetical protein [Bacillota bacterium]
MAHELGPIAEMHRLIGGDIVRVPAPFDNGAIQVGLPRPEAAALPHVDTVVQIGFEAIRMSLVDASGSPLPLQIEDHNYQPTTPNRGAARYILGAAVDVLTFRPSDALGEDGWMIAEDITLPPQHHKAMRTFAFRVSAKARDMQNDMMFVRRLVA